MTRRRAARATAVGGGAVVVVAVLVILVLVVTFVRRPLPERDGTVTLPGLQGEVEIIRDDRGVPQIYADDPESLMRAQGYVHAQDRFFEMDLRRHVTAGRLSELVGENEDALQADAVVRTLGWRRVAQQELAGLKPETRNYLEAYADGVNDYVRGRSASELSVSYTLLARANPLPRIEPWTPVDSLAWLKAMAWDLRSNYEEELGRARAMTKVRNIRRVAQLYPQYPFKDHPTITTQTGDLGGNGGDLGRVASPTTQRERVAADEPADTPAENTDPDAAGAWNPDDMQEVLASNPAQRALAAADRAVQAVPDLVGEGEGIGSNSWVVSGDHTASGKPMLENDPHLGMSMPGIWHQSGLHCRTVSEACPFDVAGFDFAGLPGIVIGHNGKIAWGLTNLYPDVTDFYLERVVGDRVESGGAMKPLTTRKETIEVAGSDPVTITVRETEHGPLLSDVIDSVRDAGGTAPAPGDANTAPEDETPAPQDEPTAAPGEEEPAPGDENAQRDTTYAVALAWTALKPGRSMDALFAIDTAQNFAEFRAGALLLDAPAQNLVYADTEGHIGYQAPGRIPLRGPGRPGAPVPGDGTWPHPGWDPNYTWRGTVRPEQLPWVLDPPKGYIVAANQAVQPSPARPRLTNDWDYGYRAARIDGLLQSAKEDGRKLTVGDFRSMQSDTRNGIAAVLVPLLLRLHGQGSTTDPFTDEAVQLLKGWDYSQPTDSAAAAYFNVIWATILKSTFADELPEGFRPDGGDRWFAAVQRLLASPKDQWWDDLSTPDVVETRDEVLRRSLSTARLQLTSTLGKDPGRWQWGRLHRLRLEQTPLGGDGTPGVVHRLVNRGPYPAPGGPSIVNAFAYDASTGTFDVVAAPSMRMIVDLGDLDRSRWVNQTGISGHPWDSHYDDQLETWLKGEDYPWPFTRDAVDEAADDRQTLKPGPG